MFHRLCIASTSNAHWAHWAYSNLCQQLDRRGVPAIAIWHKGSFQITLEVSSEQRRWLQSLLDAEIIYSLTTETSAIDITARSTDFPDRAVFYEDPLIALLPKGRAAQATAPRRNTA